MAQRSEFADAYKLKPDVLEKRNARLQRRSIEWKNLRYEEVGKRRKIDLENLSPLQEQDQNVSNSHYEDKTPVKPVDSSDDKKLKTELLKQRLVQWKQEKERKKKQEAVDKAKKRQFKVTGVTHKDTHLFVKDKQSTNSKPSRVNKTTTATTAKPAQSSVTAKPAASKPVSQPPATRRNQANTSNDVSKSKTRAAASAKQTKPQAKQTTTVPQTRVTRQTRSAAKLKSSPKVTKPTQSRIQKSTKTVEEPKQVKATRSKKLSPEYNISLDKVAISRGESFAPNDFTFNAPDNLKTFGFQPLSPASAASFLDPNRDLTSTSFFYHEPATGRCSTPKSSMEEDLAAAHDETILNSNKTVVKHSPVKKISRSSARSNVSTDSESENTQDATVVKAPESSQQIESKDESSKQNKSKSLRKSTRQVTSSDEEVVKSDCETEKTQKDNSTEVESEIEATTNKDGKSESKGKGNSEDEAETKKVESEKVETPRRTRGKKEETISGDEIEKVEKKEVKTPRPSRAKTEDETKKDDSEEVKTPRRTRRQSVQKTTDESSAETSMTVLKNISEKTPVITPSKAKRRSVQSKTVDDPVNESKTNFDNLVITVDADVITPKKTRRRSVRNQTIEDIKDTESSENASGSDTESKRVRTPKSAKRRSTRKSSSSEPVVETCPGTPVAMEPIQEEKDLCDDEVFHPDTKSETTESTDSSNIQGKEIEVAEDAASTPNKENCTPVRSRRNSAADACFRQPGLPMSAQRSGRKRRRTETDAEHAHPKSPEEWVKILQTSPMVEMRRRTPKAARLDDSLSQPLNFDDVLDEAGSVKPMEAMVVEMETTPAEEVDTNTESKVEKMEETNQKEDTLKEDTKSAGEIKDDKDEEHDVPYFRRLLVSETKRLNKHSDEWNVISKENNISEEIEGQIRTTVGQAQLLIAQRFKQFTGLVDNCEFGTGEKETTCTDLQGFWEMIYFQVEDVDKKFVKLTELRANGWKEKEPVVPVKKVAKKKAVTAKPKAVGGKSKFAAFRAQMKREKEEAAKAAVVETVKVFDAGFFKVSSPVKSPAVHCEGGSPAKSSPASSDEVSSTDSLTVDKNVAQVLINKTPRRKSYVPSVPSPLLRDITPKPKPRPRRSLCADQVQSSPVGIFTPPPASAAEASPQVITSPTPSANPTTTPKRRSIRLRKSLTLTPTEEERSNKESDKAEEGGSLLDPCFLQPSASSNDHNDSDCDLSKFMQPTTPSQAEEDLDSSFSKFFQPTVQPRSTRKSALKTLPSTQKRRSRRSVQFSVAEETSPVKGPRLPSTPYSTRDSTAPKPRVSYGEYLFTPPKEDKEEDTQDSPSTRGRPRPSLLFTPSNTDNCSESAGDNLMVFTP